MAGLVGVASPCLVDCQVLPWAEDANYLWARAGHDMADCSVLGFLGLVLDQWQVDLGAGVGGCRATGARSSLALLVYEASSRHGLLQGPGCPKAGVSLLVSGAGSQGSWLRGSRCLRAGVSEPGPKGLESAY